MGYIEDNLSQNEKIMAKIKHSWAGLISVFLRLLLFCALAAFCFSIKQIMAKLGGGFSQSDIIDNLYCTIFYVLGGFVLFAGLIIFLSQIFEIKSAQLVVTNKRVFGRRGFISKRTTDIMLSKIDTININNGLFGAILGYGTVEIVSAASGRMTRAERATLQYGFVSNTSEFRKAVLETIDKVKKEEQEAQARSLSEAMKK